MADTIYTWLENNSRTNLDYKTKGMVLVKKSFGGKIKAVVQKIDKYTEVVKYKTVKVKINELSDNDLVTLIKYFEEKRATNYIDLLNKEIEFRKRRLFNTDEKRPAELNNSLKIKYNIKKKVLKKNNYGAKKNISLPKRDFILLPTLNRNLGEFEFSRLGLGFKVKFNIVNPNTYVKKLSKYEKGDTYNETSLINNIYIKLEKIIFSYLQSNDHVYSSNEDLLSDPELKNAIDMFGQKYGIEIPSLKVVLSRENRLREHGLNDEQIDVVLKYPDTESSAIIKSDVEKLKEERKELITKYQEFGIEVDDDGILYGVAELIAREFVSNLPLDYKISIFDDKVVSSDVISEICREYSSPIKMR